MRNKHKACYDRYQDKGRSDFVAGDGQMVAEDPDYVEQPPVIQKFEEQPVKKRQKVDEASAEASARERKESWSQAGVG